MCWGSQQPHLAPDHRDDVAARDRVCGWHVAVPLLAIGAAIGSAVPIASSIPTSAKALPYQLAISTSAAVFMLLALSVVDLL